MKISASNHAGSIYLNSASQPLLPAELHRILQDARRCSCAVWAKDNLLRRRSAHSWLCYSPVIDTLEHLHAFSIAARRPTPAT